MSKEKIASLITAARKRAGYRTMYEFCKRTGMSIGHLHEIENGVSSPSVGTLEKYFDTIDWDVVVTFRPRK